MPVGNFDSTKHSQLMNLLFKIALTIDSIAILVVLYFLISDALKQTTEHNGMLSLLTLLFSGWIVLCFYLFNNVNVYLGTAFAWLPAIPIVMYAFFLAALLILNPDFK